MNSEDHDPPAEREFTSTIDLVLRAQAGEDHALSTLFERYMPRVRRLVRSKLGARLRERVESIDIVQDTFVQAARGFPHFRRHNDRSLINYLSKIAENRISEEIRYHWSQRRSRDRETSMTAVDLDGIAGESPSRIVARSQVSAIVRECIAALPADSRQSIVLRCFCGLPFADVAKQTNRPSADAARMFHRDTAIKRLAEALLRRGLTALDLPA